MRTILNKPELLKEAQGILSHPHRTAEFSIWLGDQLLQQIKKYPEWEQTHPVVLGSWARDEICLKSDLDILFCGDEEKVKALTSKLNEQGFKLRYRMPSDSQDWTAQVEAFDILALLKGRPLTPHAAEMLQSQQQKILAKKKKMGRELLKAVRSERKNRAQRFDSITNFLEPNLKYSPGGLRDIEQGLQIYELFAEKILHPEHALDALEHHKKQLLSLRQKLHLEGLGDVLVSTSQFELTRWMNFETQKDFMHELQAGFSRAHFYSEWLIEAANASRATFNQAEKVKLAKAEDLSRVLKKDPSILIQKRVRENLSHFFPNSQAKRTAPLRAKILDDIVSIKTSESVLIAHFNSRLIDKLLPEIKRLVGYVQHDQYHRFTADNHILQACREFKRVFHFPKELGALKIFHKKLNSDDWKILSWTCLYHDLAKGLETQEHSEAGVEIVRRDFKAYGFPKKFIDEVAWLVQNHLELSQASFRKNPKSLKVWDELKQKQVEGKNLYRLAIFTAIDIRATNPEAWNDWKSRLMRDLVVNLESRSAQNFFDFAKERKKQKLNLSEEIYEELDPLLVDSLSSQTFVKDLKNAEAAELLAADLKPLVIKNKNSEVWIRFHSREDRSGLLADYVAQLYSLGFGIRHASIQTIPGVGAYDWFQVITTKQPAQIRKIIEHANHSRKEIPPVRFTQIEVVSSDDKEWVLSFRGIDQAGLLAFAAQTLADHHISIRSAKVHTWGKQIEDIFIVKPHGQLSELLVSLRKIFIG